MGPLSCPICPVLNVGVLWPNSWMDQDETWHAGRPGTWPHCVRWGPSSLQKKDTAPTQFLSHVYCGQTVGWIKTPLGTEVDLGPRHIVLDGDPAPPRRKGHNSPPPSFRPMSIVAMVAHLSYC